MEQGGVKEHARLGVVTIMQDYRYLGRGKNLALITELFSTYMEPLSRVSRGKCHFDRKLAAFFDRNLAGPKVGEVADGR
jgi:hypothetical protein